MCRACRCVLCGAAIRGTNGWRCDNAIRRQAWRLLYVDQKHLEDGVGKKVGGATVHPGPNTFVRLTALDDIAEILEEHPIRLFLLHTCNAGKNVPFVQLIADRLQAYVRAHTESIEYELPPVSRLHAMYRDEPATPDGLHEWPVRLLAAERRPGTKPEPPKPI